MEPEGGKNPFVPGDKPLCVAWLVENKYILKSFMKLLKVCVFAVSHASLSGPCFKFLSHVLKLNWVANLSAFPLQRLALTGKENNTLASNHFNMCVCVAGGVRANLGFCMGRGGSCHRREGETQRRGENERGSRKERVYIIPIGSLVERSDHFSYSLNSTHLTSHCFLLRNPGHY